MDKRSPMSWKSGAKVDHWNYNYAEPHNSKAVYNSPTKYAVASRCHPHMNINEYPRRPKEEDYSWVREAEEVAQVLPSTHELSPKRRGPLSDGGTESPRSGTASRASAFSKDNPNHASFGSKGNGAGKSGKFGAVAGGSAFGAVDEFKGHKAGGHYSSKNKSLLEITRTGEIDTQKLRDIAEAKAAILLAGGSLADRE
jgi:hypothetical protein